MDINNLNSNKNTQTGLPMMALQDIPTPNANAQEIVALIKEDGKVAGYKLSDGRMITREEGVQLAKTGGILNVGVAVNQGTEYLKSLPDHTENNNLGNLPSITWK